MDDSLLLQSAQSVQLEVTKRKNWAGGVELERRFVSDRYETSSDVQTARCTITSYSLFADKSPA